MNVGRAITCALQEQRERDREELAWEVRLRDGNARAFAEATGTHPPSIVTRGQGH